MRPEKLLRRIRAGQTENVRFGDLVRLLKALGFVETRTRGSHHWFAHATCEAHISVQPHGSKAKAYQLRQLLGRIEKYNLSLR